MKEDFVCYTLEDVVNNGENGNSGNNGDNGNTNGNGNTTNNERILSMALKIVLFLYFAF